MEISDGYDLRAVIMPANWERQPAQSANSTTTGT